MCADHLQPFITEVKGTRRLAFSLSLFFMFLFWHTWSSRAAQLLCCLMLVVLFPLHWNSLASGS